MPILAGKYKTSHDGVTESGPLIADANGVYIGAVDRVERKGLFKKLTHYKPGYVLMRWEDATGYEIAAPEPHQFAGSTTNANDVILTFKTATTQHSFTLHLTSVTRVRNALGPYLAQIDARN
jgi:hypothetical protein